MTKKIWTIEEIEIIFSLQSSFDYNQFEKEFGFSIGEVSGCNNLFCVSDQTIHIYADAQKEDYQEFVNFLNQLNMSDYTEIIEKNKVFATFIKSHSLTDEQIKNLKDEANEFLIKVRSDKTLYDKLREEVFNHLNNL